MRRQLGQLGHHLNELVHQLDQLRHQLSHFIKLLLYTDYQITRSVFLFCFRNNIVPVAMGGRKADYLQAAPPHSFIHVEDFSSAKHLAAFLVELNNTDSLYNEYFRWKGTGQFINTKFWCRLCAMLHDDEKPKIWYSDFNAWWRHPAACRSDRWEAT